MLILTRKQNESVVIDDDIKITILGTKGQDVKIGLKRLRMWTYGVRRFTANEKKARANRSGFLLFSRPGKLALV